jgi:hypothetical protein
MGIAFAGDERLDHRTTGHAEQVGGDHGQLDPGVFQQLVQPLTLADPFADQLATVAGEVPQPPDRRGRDERGTDQAVLDQFGDPRRIGDIFSELKTILGFGG